MSTALLRCDRVFLLLNAAGPGEVTAYLVRPATRLIATAMITAPNR